MTDGFKVIDDLQILEALRLAERAGRERPGAVGELHAILFDPPGDGHRGAVQRGRHAWGGAAVVMRGVREGFMRTDRITAHAMHVDGGGIAADRNAEADVRSPDVRDQPKYLRTVETFDVPRICAAGRRSRCHHLAPKKPAGSAILDSAVNQIADEFYRVIYLNVARVLRTVRQFDNAV